jgi:PAS domain S-box-containing protein/putative nucleotidyltransferase with HDIG domain
MKAIVADGEGFIQGIETNISRNYIVLGEEIYLADGRILERDYIPIDSDGRQTGHLWKYRDITRQKRRENEIRNLARFASENPSPVMRVRQDGLILYANEASRDLLNLWQTEVGGHMAWDWQVFVSDLIRTGKREEIEVPCDDNIYSILFAPIPEEKYVNLYCRDITEYKKVEKALRSAEEKYRTIFEGAIEGIFQSTPGGQFLTANPALAHMWGYESPADLIDNIQDISHQIYTEPDRRAEFLRQMQKNGEVRGFDYQVRKKNGELIWVSENARAVHDDGGAILYYEGNIQDITERKWAEEALARRAQELRTLYETSLEINALPDMSSLLQVIVERAATLVNAPMGGIYLVRPDGESVELAVNHNLPSDYLGIVLRLGEGLSGRVAQSGEVLAIEDYSQWEGRANIYTDSPFRRVLGVPLKIGERIIGVLNITDNQKVGSYHEDEIHLVSMFANQAAIAIENARLYETVQSELTERKQVEDALLLTQFCVDRASIGIMRTGTQARILSVNDQMCRMLGYTAEEFANMHVYDIDPTFPPEKWEDHRQHLQRNGSDKFETIHRRKDGTLFPVEVTNSYLEFQNGEYSFSFIQDISDRKHAEAERERLLSILEASLNEIYIFDTDTLEFQYVNTGARRNLGYSLEQLRTMTPLDLKPTFTKASFQELITPLLRREQEVIVFETVHRRADASLYFVEVHLQLVERNGEQVFLAIINDITGRKQAEAALREREARYRSLFEDSPISLWEEDFSAVKGRLDGLRKEGVTDFREYLLAHLEIAAECAALVKVVDVNKAALDFLGAKSKNDLPGNLGKLFGDETFVGFAEELIWIAEGRHSFEWEGKNRTLDGELREVQLNWSVVPGHEEDLSKVIVSIIDITERKRAERALRESETRLSSIFRASPLPITISRLADNRFTDVNEAFYKLTGYDRKEVIGHTPRELNLWVNPERREHLLHDLHEKGSVQDFEFRIRRRSGNTLDMQISAEYVELAGEQCMLTIAQDITERKRAEEKIQKQLKRITALRDIDRTITSSLDLNLTLNRLLGQVTEQLELDAAALLLFNPHTYTLEYFVARGLNETDFRNVQVQLGEEYAGQVALERRVINVNLQNSVGPIRNNNPILRLGFAEYYGIPLIAKGQMRGVLEVFHRAQLNPDTEWLDYLDTLAGQAAIAIDNVRLFDGLQQTNLELSLAYDATIEGWSHALDLRDKETEGHTQRVTEMTIELARKFGLGQKQLTNIRWGALLHDIGKMGVPDAILLKSNKLTDEEWEIMKRHPALAYEMLSRIHYLRDAVEIPHYHHEKWDGTGYPHGLKGEQIPLAARIFAIADIWDALRSDRPYRPAWTTAKALKYIRELSGTHLDPKVVEAFLESKIYKK